MSALTRLKDGQNSFEWGEKAPKVEVDIAGAINACVYREDTAALVAEDIRLGRLIHVTELPTVIADEH